MPPERRGDPIRRLIFCALNAGSDTKIPLARYLIENGKEAWVDPETKAKVQHLKTWNPATDAPGFGDTDEEEESEEEQKQEVTLKTNAETKQRKNEEEDSARKKVPRQGAELRPPAKGVYGEEPLGNMQRPKETTFKWFSHHSPSTDDVERETFEDLVTRTAVKTHRQEAKMREEGDVSLTETEEVSPSPARASPTEEADENEERESEPKPAANKNSYTDFRTREKAPSDPGTDYERSYNTPWWGGKGKNTYNSAPWNTRRHTAYKHTDMPPEVSGPYKGMPKRMNWQTDRPEYKRVCFDIWYDPEDAEKRSAT